jgi:hypothetical protein
MTLTRGHVGVGREKHLCKLRDRVLVAELGKPGWPDEIRVPYSQIDVGGVRDEQFVAS